MAQLKFIAGLLILLVFAAWFSNAHALQDGDVDVEVGTVSKGKEMFNEGLATIATKQIVGGRKMSPVAKARKPEKPQKVKETGGAVERTSISSTASHKHAGECEGRTYCKQSVSHHFTYEDVDDKGFVAFNADYHAPRHHPPKNN